MSAAFPDLPSGTAGEVLAGIWRIILNDLSIDSARMDSLVEQYSRKMTHVDSRKRVEWYGNVSSDLREKDMTWSTFVRGPRCLNAKKVTMEFILQHRVSQSRHVLEIHYGAPNEPEEVLTPQGELPPTELHFFASRILHELGVSVTVFNDLLTSYMRRTLKAHNSAPNRTHVRSNLRKDFQQPRLSWANFIKQLDFLTIPSFEVIITIEYNGRRVRKSVHACRVILNDVQDMLGDMSESEFLNPPDIERVSDE